MAEFLTSNTISYYIENIFKEAAGEILILFPYLQLSAGFYDLLKESSNRGISIVLVYSNEDLLTEEKLLLGELANLEIYHSENLNAKCCCSEENVIISSMDLHNYTDNNSLEMGVLFNKTEDSALYRRTCNEIKSIIGSSMNMNIHKRPVDQIIEPAVKVKKIYHGFCIKCAMPVSYNTDNPYCRSCAPISDAADEGRYCHLCGLPASTRKSSPVCGVCIAEV